MKKYPAFVLVGSFFATMEEFLTVLVVKRDLTSYLFTLFVLFPVFLTFVYFSSRTLNWLLNNEPARDLAHYFVYGISGLLIEWFLIGLAPWSDPAANPVLMAAFQLGMFSFWATVAFAPRLFAKPQEINRQTGKSILKFYIPYFALAYIISLTVSAQMRFLTIISLIIFGYLFLNLFYLKYFVQSFKHSGRLAD